MRKACPGCGRPIVWATNVLTGGRIPLDPTAAVYRVIRHDAGGDPVVILVKQDESGEREVMLNHFVTCPAREDFRRRPREAEVTPHG